MWSPAMAWRRRRTVGAKKEDVRERRAAEWEMEGAAGALGREWHWE